MSSFYDNIYELRMGQDLSDCCRKEGEGERALHPTIIQALPTSTPFDVDSRVNGNIGNRYNPMLIESINQSETINPTVYVNPNDLNQLEQFLTEFPSERIQTVSETLDQLPSLTRPDQSVPVRIFKLKDERIYQGTIMNNKRQGWGRQIWPNGSFYEGYWKDDSQNGFGRFVYINGDCYQGQWLSDKANGKGNYYSRDGDRYVGQWMNDLKEGRGSEHFADGSVYQGYFKNGKKNGPGVFRWNDMSLYQGQYVNDMFHGRGKYNWPNGMQYTGFWAYNQMHGLGQLKWGNGQVYKGYFINGTRQGYGQFYWSNGQCFRGQFLQGRWAKGTISSPNGIQRQVLNEIALSY